MLAAICGDMANAMIYMQIQKTVKWLLFQGIAKSKNHFANLYENN